jgi:hypothetical protein
VSEKHDIKVRLLSLAQSLPKKVCVQEKRIIFIPSEIFPDRNPQSEGARALYTSFARSIFEYHDSSRLRQNQTIKGVELIVLKDHIPRLLDIIKVLAKAAGYSTEQIAEIKSEKYEQSTTISKSQDKPAFAAEEVARDPTSPWYRPRSS